jgi:hypothetical protein
LGSLELFNEVIRAVVGEISRFYVRYSHQRFGKRGNYMPTVNTDGWGSDIFTVI